MLFTNITENIPTAATIICTTSISHLQRCRTSSPWRLRVGRPTCCCAWNSSNLWRILCPSKKGRGRGKDRTWALRWGLVRVQSVHHLSVQPVCLFLEQKSQWSCSGRTLSTSTLIHSRSVQKIKNLTRCRLSTYLVGHFDGISDGRILMFFVDEMRA